MVMKKWDKFHDQRRDFMTAKRSTFRMCVTLRQQHKPRTCQSMANTLQVDGLARITGLTPAPIQRRILTVTTELTAHTIHMYPVDMCIIVGRTKRNHEEENHPLPEKRWGTQVIRATNQLSIVVSND